LSGRLVIAGRDRVKPGHVGTFEHGMSNPAQYSATEVLRNGRRVEIRAERPEDREAILAAVHRTSAQSLFRRFFAVKRNFSEQEISFFLNIDFATHVALVALVEEKERPTIVGGVRYIVSQPGKAEVAFAVIDEYQGQGIGAKLLQHLIAIAREAGLQQFIAEVLSENIPMLKVFEKSGLPVTADANRPRKVPSRQ
jgi:RimJ/RimL family protein N-acetyltransferase